MVNTMKISRRSLLGSAIVAPLLPYYKFIPTYHYELEKLARSLFPSLCKVIDNNPDVPIIVWPNSEIQFTLGKIVQYISNKKPFYAENYEDNLLDNNNFSKIISLFANRNNGMSTMCFGKNFIYHAYPGQIANAIETFEQRERQLQTY